jgi:hypothetical protein
MQYACTKNQFPLGVWPGRLSLGCQGKSPTKCQRDRTMKSAVIFRIFSTALRDSYRPFFEALKEHLRMEVLGIIALVSFQQAERMGAVASTSAIRWSKSTKRSKSDIMLGVLRVGDSECIRYHIFRTLTAGPDLSFVLCACWILVQACIGIYKPAPWTNKNIP